MGVYVDDMRMPARPAGYRGRGVPKWSHMMADTHEELMSFAEQLGLKPEWLQYEGTNREHFDLTDTMRTKALALGAEPISYHPGTGLFVMLQVARSGGDAEIIRKRQSAFDEERKSLTL